VRDDKRVTGRCAARVAGLAVAAAICLLTGPAFGAEGPAPGSDGPSAGLSPLWYLAPLGACLALAFAFFFYRSVMRTSEGDPEMAEIAGHVRRGAMAYLKQQYKVVAVFFAVAFVILMVVAFGLGAQSGLVPFAFLTGGFFSGLCGYIGMRTATNAGARTANGARESLDRGLRIAFRSGAVMGLVVVGFNLLHISVWFFVLHQFTNIGLREITVIMLCSAFGASSQALFARVGGGIFTKAADVGADLVGKVEAGIPEDDPRNPATIADNVGDNVGDVAGMGADLYESYAGAILATATLGVAAVSGVTGQLTAVVLPMALAGVGIMVSIFGCFAVRTREEASQRQLLKALGRGVHLSSLLILVLSAGLVYLLMPGHFGLWGSIAAGLIAGVLIGKSSEFYTSSEYRPTKFISEQSKTGPATVIIAGLSVGMGSTAIPVLVVGAATLLAFGLPGGFENAALGLYGIGLAAVGMLSTLGITLATDAYGPIADNAGGNAEMTGQEAYVRERTDALDALGNTTAATGKGFAIGSAALTALALLAAYVEQIRLGLDRIGQSTLKFAERSVNLMEATMADFMEYYDVTLMNPRLLVGVFLGAMLAFAFCSKTMRAVGRAAGLMVEEVRRQFREIAGIMEGTAKPDYDACVRISTRAAQREMIVPSVMALVAPVMVGLLLGVPGVMGLLAGALTTGFVLAIMMANAGGAWDNAKKYIEAGHLGGKGSDNHKAAVVGDTVGDPFKDTSGPSLNILIKLMSMVSIVVAGLVVKFYPAIERLLRMSTK